MECKISQRIFELRKESGLSQKALAKEIGVTQKAIDFWEKGINEPKATYILNLAVFFKCSPSYLLGYED
ncbi:MAG: helix-turn-helix domain-containing protein [Clostridia bacterium]|nr:helix-turn-helix domain-containing protein [Clostridia bacterium]